MAEMTYSIRNTPAGYRIGSVAALCSVPASTLRVWEARYATFTPVKSAGGHRLYSEGDVLKATLLKRLTEQGHAISSIAALDTTVLNGLLQHQNNAQLHNAARGLEAQTVSAAVIGLALGGRVTSKKFKQAFLTHSLEVTDIFADVETALTSVFQQHPQFLVVRINSLHALAQADLHRLIDTHKIAHAIVLYNFGQEKVIEAMRRTGMVVRREPVSDYELADLISSALFVNPAESMGALGPGAAIPPRKYDDEVLARVAGISTNVLCECPRHVAEIIGHLVSFEQYSQDCLNKSAEDAHLHAYLRSVSGSARALFERALEMVAEHEGIQLQPV